ncbi:B3 domain-containing protein Os11g0197600-like [Rutidosis leptorrhynchoides]|uniref:B3 domain-containing protein Os11g0197600-like n=1 Tax=Rutidosis leptorrhynchoides TaxID=125765 RepID=UPI003A99FDF5
MMNATSRPHFIKAFNPNISFHKLKIPSKFGKHLEGKTSGTVSLTGPSGNTWHADLAEQTDGLFILDGWTGFVRDHFLESGDSLVFRYDGDLHFTVQIFDQSSCEKETAFSAECHQDLSIFDQHFGKKREREHGSLLTNTVDYIPKKPRTSQVDMQLELQDYINNAEFCGSALKNRITHAIPLSEVCPDDNGLGRISAFEADKIAQSFTSSFPHFSQVMKRFNISGSYTLNVPYQFATAYLPNCKIKLVLHNLKGESWTVNSIPTTRVQTSHTFCGGWLSFVRGNNINVKDVCIFELIGKYEMRVSILRVTQEPLDYEHCDSEDLANGTCQKTNEKLTKKVNFIGKVKCDISAKGSVDASQSRTTNGKMRGLQENRGSNMMGFTSLKSAPEEKMAAESFVTSFPYFVRVMKKFNVGGSYTLKIPYRFSMEHLPSCRTEITLHNLKGECWTVNSIPTFKVQTLHTFCGGWMAFVRDNDLKMGDICIFELIGTCEMRVHVSGVGKDFADLDYQIENGSSNELGNGSS